jgi:hypothetical protein
MNPTGQVHALLAGVNSLEVPLQLLFRDFVWRIIRPTVTIVFGCLTCYTRTNCGSNSSAYYESEGDPNTYANELLSCLPAFAPIALIYFNLI